MTNEKKKRIRKLESEIEALLIAIVRESASHQFYLGLFENHKGTSTGDIFSELAAGESSHKDELEVKIAELQAELEKLKKK
ncbi:MAG: hypothetical protein GY793_12210 [Proteobacteria bacterium]|nr:hypothetical protein [Pseudomonadota bacterium]